MLKRAVPRVASAGTLKMRAKRSPPLLQIASRMAASPPRKPVRFRLEGAGE
jgi:hypothetical protein